MSHCSNQLLQRDPLDAKLIEARRILSRVLVQMRRDGAAIEEQAATASRLLAVLGADVHDIATVISWFRSLPMASRWALPISVVRRIQVLACRPFAYVINLRKRSDRWRDVVVQVTGGIARMALDGGCAHADPWLARRRWHTD